MLPLPVRSAAQPFELIPAVDLKDGRCVQLRQGKKEDVIFSSAVDPVRIQVDDVQPARTQQSPLFRDTNGIHGR